MKPLATFFNLVVLSLMLIVGSVIFAFGFSYGFLVIVNLFYQPPGPNLSGVSAILLFVFLTIVLVLVGLSTMVKFHFPKTDGNATIGETTDDPADESTPGEN